MIELQDRLYTSTEVADILGVSLRSVYRYLEEDKLHAEVKTATGRHRFTKKNIIDFLYPEGVPQSQVSTRSKIVPDAGQEDVEVKVTSETSQQQQVDQPPAVTVQVDTEAAQTTVQQPVQPVTSDMEEEETSEEEPKTEMEDEEPIDWLAKFREAAKKFKEEEEAKAAGTTETATAQPAPQPAQVQDAQPQQAPQPAAQPVQQPVQPASQNQVKYSDQPAFTSAPSAAGSVSGLAQQPAPEPQPEPQPQPAAPPEPEFRVFYYKSALGGLKDIAQNIDKSARSSSVEYAFTMNAGLSLFKPIKPFSMLHAYVKPEHREFYETNLKLNPAPEDDAQLCMILTKDNSIFRSRAEMHGLYVVSKTQLIKDIDRFGDQELVSEAQSIIG